MYVSIINSYNYSYTAVEWPVKFIRHTTIQLYNNKNACSNFCCYEHKNPPNLCEFLNDIKLKLQIIANY